MTKRSIYRFEGQVSVFWEDAPDGAGLNYRDLYPEAPPFLGKDRSAGSDATQDGDERRLR